MTGDRCPVCGSEGRVLHRQLADHLFGAPGSWDVLRCRDRRCRSLWPDPMPAPSSLGDLYESYYTHDGPAQGTSRARALLQRLWPTPWAARRAEARRRMVPGGLPPGRLLEIGCGNGVNLVRLHDAGWTVIGQDIDAKAATAAAAAGIPVEGTPFEAGAFPEAAFDVVLANHVIEHVPDPVATAAVARDVLAPGGQLLIYTPNADSLGHALFRSWWRGLEVPRHLTVFTPGSLEVVLRRAGFTDVRVTTTSALAASMATLSLDHRWTGLPAPLRAVLVRLVAFGHQVAADLAHLVRPGSGDELVGVARVTPQ